MFWDTTDAWVNARENFKYFSNKENGYTDKEIIEIRASKYDSGVNGTISVAYSDLQIELDSLGIREGDLMYFYNQEEGIHHASVISKVEDGKIYYTANSLNRFDQELGDGIESNGGVVVVRISA